MSAIERQQFLQQITQRLVIFTGVVMLLLGIGIYTYVFGVENKQTSYLMLLVFICGLLGGFVSIQQRLPSISLEELRVLASSWVSITLIPINGGIFALVLMLMFVGEILQGQLFPTFADHFKITDAPTFFDWIKNGYPQTGTDVAKLLFWSFVSGFSERFVPQIIRRTAEDASEPPKPQTDSEKA